MAYTGFLNWSWALLFAYIAAFVGFSETYQQKILNDVLFLSALQPPRHLKHTLFIIMRWRWWAWHSDSLKPCPSGMSHQSSSQDLAVPNVNRPMTSLRSWHKLAGHEGSLCYRSLCLSDPHPHWQQGWTLKPSAEMQYGQFFFYLGFSTWTFKKYSGKFESTANVLKRKNWIFRPFALTL